MKRSQFLQAFWLLPPLLLQSCKKDELPTTPTIVTGKVVDEDNNPIEGYEFQFNGYDKTGILTQNITFDLYSKTNKEGIFTFSIIVPNGTSNVNFKPIGIKLMNGTTNIKYSDISLFSDGVYQKQGNSLTRNQIKYGITTTLNYQVKINK